MDRGQRQGQQRAEGERTPREGGGRRDGKKEARDRHFEFLKVRCRLLFFTVATS